ARPADGVAPRMLAEITRKMNAKSGKRVSEKNTDFYMNLSEIPLKLSPGADYLFLVVAEGGEAGLAVFVDGKMAAQAKPGAFPFIGCRLLTPAQQNTGDSSQPRAGCAIDAQRAGAMTILGPSANARDVERWAVDSREAAEPLA